MSNRQAWIDLNTDDIRNMLISLIGYRFGPEPETRLEDIRAERSAYMQKFIKLAAIGAADTVLELGSGCGFGTRALALKAGRVIACDISPAYLSFARDELVGVNNIELCLVQSRDLSDIADNSVDKVVSASVFIHFNIYDIYLYFIEFKRILKNKGKVVFDFADAHSLGGLMQRARLVDQFREHAAYYQQDATGIAGLVQWNSAQGICAVAKLAGFRKYRRWGYRMVFQRLDD